MAVPPAFAEPEPLVLPKLVLDPIWALRPWPAVVTVAGHVFTVPAVPAVDWLVPLMAEVPDLDDILPGLLPDGERDAWDDLLYSEALELADAQMLALDVVGLVSSRKWWVAMRLIAAIKSAWDHIAFEMSQVDATRVSLAAWLDVAYYHIMSGMKPENRTMFLSQLEMVPREMVQAEVEELTMTTDAFLSLAD